MKRLGTGKWTLATALLVGILSVQTIRSHQQATGGQQIIPSSDLQLATTNAAVSPNHTDQRPTLYTYAAYQNRTQQQQQQHVHNSSLMIPQNLGKKPEQLQLNSSKTVNFGDQSSASLFRPSIVRNLFKLGNRNRGAGGKGHKKDEQEDEQEEVVTKTIMVPMSGESDDEAENEDGFVPAKRFRSKLPAIGSPAGAATSSSSAAADEIDTQKPEASLQLTSTEMNRLLNDGDGPQLYREREVHGDGVTVGEEPAHRFRASATMSGGNFYGNAIPGGGNPFGGANPMLMQSPSSMFGPSGFSSYQNQLAQAGSDQMGGGADQLGFSHRFGGQFQEDAFNSAGRLMSSPNEYNELQSARGEFAAGHSPASYPRAASEFLANGGGAGGDAFGAQFGGQQQQMFAGGPMLERHSSELYGSSNGQQFHQQFGAEPIHHQNQFDPSLDRLSQAGSHSGGGYFGDDFTSRYGSSPVMGGANQAMFGADQRAFASQQNLMRGAGGPMAYSGAPDGSGRLLPLTPVVPVAEEVAPSSNHQDTYPTTTANDQRKVQAQQQQQVEQFQARSPQGAAEVQEGFDDDPVDAQPQQRGYSSPGEDDSGEQSDQSDRFGGNDGETTMSSVQDMPSLNDKQHQDEGHSLVLNFPPPVTPEASQYVEFSQTGAAGYHGPTSLRRQQHQHHHQQQQQQHQQQQQQLAQRSAALLNHKRRTNLNSDDEGLISAHAGKYIID